MKNDTEKVVLLQVKDLMSITSDGPVNFRYDNLYTEGISKLSWKEFMWMLLHIPQQSIKNGIEHDIYSTMTFMFIHNGIFSQFVYYIHSLLH